MLPIKIMDKNRYATHLFVLQKPQRLFCVISIISRILENCAELLQMEKSCYKPIQFSFVFRVRAKLTLPSYLQQSLKIFCVRNSKPGRVKRNKDLLENYIKSAFMFGLPSYPLKL